jgi:hypothetical protein
MVFLVVVLTPVQGDGQRSKTHFSLHLCGGMVVTGTKSRSRYQAEPTINAPSDGGRN